MSMGIYSSQYAKGQTETGVGVSDSKQAMFKFK